MKIDPTLAINPQQLGGIETSVLDNGPGRGVRIAWINTGGGLRYKVLLDRGFDIADAEFLGQSLTWHSYGGVIAPSPAYDRGYEWLRSFAGGLLVSAGPLNTGEAFQENGREYGLHGSHSNTQGFVESIVNPDPALGKLHLSLTGVVRTARVFGPNLELRRTFSGTLGDPSIATHDHFVNRGNEPCPFAWLLHINFGYPLLEPEASTLCYGSRITPAFNSDDWFRADRPYHRVPRPQEVHRGSGEVVCYVDPPRDAEGAVTLGVVNEQRAFGVRLNYSIADYPRLANWQHWGPGGSFVSALEPMTAGLEGHADDRKRGWFETLEPGESRDLRCTLTAVSGMADLQELLAINNQAG